MAQVEMQAGPFRVVSLMSREAADELGLEPGSPRRRLDQVHPRRRRDPGGLNVPPYRRSPCWPPSPRSPSTAAATTTRPPTPRRRLGRRSSGTVTVFAAASLTGTFTQLGKDFEAAQPGRQGDLQLRRQLGARAADQPGRTGRRVRLGQPRRTWTQVTDAGDPDDLRPEQAGDRRTEGQPGQDHRPRGLRGQPTARSPCAPSRCRAARPRRRCSRRPGSPPQPDSLEQDVKAALTKVRLGEVDAALVYQTDVQAAGGRGRGHRVPRGRPGGQRLPDRGRSATAPNATGAQGLRRLRPVGRGASAVLDRGRLRGAVTRSWPGGAGPAGGCRWSWCVPALLGLAFLVVPLIGLLVRAPWSTLPDRLFSADVGEALRLSLVCATSATVICLRARRTAGVAARPRRNCPAAGSSGPSSPCRWCSRRSSVASPCCCVLGRRGLLGERLDLWFGFSLPFTTAGVIVAEAFVAMPFLVIAVEGALRAADPRYEEAAATLGASRWLTFRRVTLPSIAPGVVAGAVLCWARALGEFGATITFAGNLPGPHHARCRSRCTSRWRPTRTSPSC